MAYADKRDGKLTGSFVGEAPKLGKKRRLKTLQDARDYETFCKLMGREPPTIDDGMESTGAPTFAQVAQMAKDAGGPKGKWKAERDHSLMQRIDYCVSVIGPYEAHRVDRKVLKKITESLDKRPAASGTRGPDATRKLLSNGTKNRYLAAARVVLTYGVDDGIITSRPRAPMLDEKSDRRYRDILKFGQEDVVLQLMRDAGDKLEALCVEAFLQTGLRQGELQKLAPDQITVEQVEDEDGTSVPVGVISLHLDQTKNDTCRVVILSAELAKQLRAIIATGSLPKADKVLDAFKLACKSAGYTGNLVVHSLRHTRNTRLRKAGISPAIRKKLLGHMSDEANEIYDHVDLSDLLQVEKTVQEYAGKRVRKAPAAHSQVIDIANRGAG
ncbi:MAG: tyrosine-type recombinase/integrase [Hyphomicrobiales bacterium]